jgi:orotate phosphoribosyltransferase
MTPDSVTVSNQLIKRIKESAYLTGEYTTRAGNQTNYYIDKYLFGTQPDILNLVASELSKILPPLHSFDCIAAPELGAVSIAAALSIKINKPFVIVRKGKKGYGTNNRIEGQYKENDTMIIIEDVLSTGGAALAALTVLRDNNINVTEIIGVINREEGALENIRKEGLVGKGLITSTMLHNASS